MSSKIKLVSGEYDATYVSEAFEMKSLEGSN
jgi:hypothetical protein